MGVSVMGTAVAVFGFLFVALIPVGAHNAKVEHDQHVMEKVTISVPYQVKPVAVQEQGGEHYGR
jgi:phosphotransferase system  glucose/maltose/N-acetylglucosamine-specific IIC component